MGLRRGEGADPVPLAVIELPLAESPRVSVLIPASGPRELLLACLSSIARHRPNVPFETIVVLNEAGTDADELVAAVRGITVLPSPVNLGLAGAANRARRHARGELLVLLHDDTEVEPNWLDALVAAADQYPRAGAIGSKILNFDGTLQFVGAVLRADASTGAVWGDGPAPPPDAYNEVLEVDYCGTSSLVVRASTWDCIGGLDERYYPVYYVDVDLATAIRSRGGTVLVEPASCVRHHRGASTTTTFKAFLNERNRLRYLEKWRSPERCAPLVAANDREQERSVEVEARALAKAHVGWLERELSEARATVRALSDGVDVLSRLAELEQRCASLERAREARWALARAVNDAPIRFCLGGEAHDHRTVNDHEPEPWGMWLGNGGCTIELSRASEQPRATRLVLEAHHLLSEQRTRSPLRVTINGTTVAEIVEVRGGVQRYEITIPDQIAGEPHWRIELESAGGVVPRDIGLNDDTRVLTVGLLAMTIEGGLR